MEDLARLLEENLALFEEGDFSGANDILNEISARNNWQLKELIASQKWLKELESWCRHSMMSQEIRKTLCSEFQIQPHEDQKEFCLFLKQGTSNLLNEIIAKIDTLKKLQQPAAPSAVLTFMPIETKSFKVLDSFEKVHAAIQDDRSFKDPNEVASLLESFSFETLEEFSALTKKIYLDIFSRGSANFPSIIICASSGMGKTQLPFSIDIPLLYFTLVTTVRPIYQQFSIISDYFVSILQADFNDYCSSLRSSNNNPNHDPLDDLEKFSLEKLNQTLCELRTPYFLLELTKNIFRMKLDEPSAKWPRLELKMMKTIGPEKIRPAVAFTAFTNLATKGMPEFETRTAEELKVITLCSSECEKIFHLPVIFIDEFNVNKKDETYLSSKYAFYRNVIRSCGLIPVLLGTNSKITNLITAPHASGNRKNLWAYIFHKMPPYPRDYLKEQLGVFIPPQNILFTLIYEILKNERPFFIESVLEALKVRARSDFGSNDFTAAEFTARHLQSQESFVEFFHLILEKIQREFLKRKLGNLAAFSANQIGFLDYSYNMSNYKKESEVPPESIDFHLANLRGPPGENVSKNSFLNANQKKPESFFELYRTGPFISYFHTIFAKEIPYFKPFCFFHTFEQTPLSCMAFCRNEVFFPKNHDETDFEIAECHTAFQAAKDMKFEVSATGSSEQKDTGFVEKNLESCVNLSFLIASHRNGILGKPFHEWFNLFIQQLACFPEESIDQKKFFEVGSMENEPTFPIKIQFPQEFSKSGLRFPITAFNNCEWNGFLQLLFLYFNIPIGIFTGALKESRDLKAEILDYQDPSKENLKFHSSAERNVEICQLLATSKFDWKSVKNLLPKPIENNFLSVECKLSEDTTQPNEIWRILAKMIRGKTLGTINIIVSRKFSEEHYFQKINADEKISIDFSETKSTTEGQEKITKQSFEIVEFFPKDFEIYRLKRYENNPSESIPKKSSKNDTPKKYCCYKPSEYAFKLEKVLNDENRQILRGKSKKKISEAQISKTITYEPKDGQKIIFILVSLDEIHGSHLREFSHLLKV